MTVHHEFSSLSVLPLPVLYESTNYQLAVRRGGGPTISGFQREINILGDGQAGSYQHSLINYALHLEVITGIITKHLKVNLVQVIDLLPDVLPEQFEVCNYPLFLGISGSIVDIVTIAQALRLSELFCVTRKLGQVSRLHQVEEISFKILQETYHVIIYIAEGAGVIKRPKICRCQYYIPNLTLPGANLNTEDQSIIQGGRRTTAILTPPLSLAWVDGSGSYYRWSK